MTNEDRISARGINPGVINEFKTIVKNKYGKLQTVYGMEIQKALEMYIASQGESKKNTRTHTERNEGEIETKPSPFQKKVSRVKDVMVASGAWDTEAFQRPVAKRYVSEVCGGDPRTIDRYCSVLETLWTTGR
jgi:hypothetical protein